MKTIIKLFTVIVLVTVTSLCKAQTFVSETEAITVATKYMKFHFNERAYSDAYVNKVRQYERNEQILLYEVNYKNGNSVLISGVKNVMPILGYNISSEGTSFLDVDDEIGLFYFIDKYATSIENIINRQNDTINEQWNIILNDSISFYHQNNRSQYGPLLTSKWGQSYANIGYDLHAYNYYVTETNNSCYNDYCPAGCVAVAMGQIMNYWKYPVHIPYKTEQFDWCNMPDELNTYSDNYEQERNAVARLLKDCGEYSNTNYCFLDSCQSFAWPKNAKDAFVNKFGYNDADLVRRYLNLSEWDDMIKSEIMMGRPVFYAAFDENVLNGAHAFVCDGYDDNTDMYHFNWGWNSNNPNLWITIDDIDSGTYHWNILERAIIDLYPDTNQDYCDFSLDLSRHYDKFYNEYNLHYLRPYNNVPQTATILRSVPDSSSYPDSWRTIPAGATSEYVAHEEIILQDGFVAEEYSSFYAHIEPCYSCDDTRTMESYESRTNINDYVAEKNEFTRKNKVEDSYENTYIEKEEEKLSLINIYPNPAKDVINISFSNKEENIRQFQIASTMGTIMLNIANPTKYEIDINNIPSGLYIVKIITNKGNVYFEKVVIEH